MSQPTKEQKEMKKQVAYLVAAAESYLAAIDALMKLPSTPERGRQVAKLSNQLEMCKDQVRFSPHGLDIDFRTGKPTKRPKL